MVVFVHLPNLLNQSQSQKNITGNLMLSIDLIPINLHLVLIDQTILQRYLTIIYLILYLIHTLFLDIIDIVPLHLLLNLVLFLHLMIDVHTLCIGKKTIDM
jgi:hypothetical protein